MRLIRDMVVLALFLGSIYALVFMAGVVIAP